MYTHFFNTADPAKNRDIILQGFRVSIYEGTLLRVKLCIDDVCVQDQTCKPGTKETYVSFLGIDFPLYKCLNTPIKAEFYIQGRGIKIEEYIRKPTVKDLQMRARRENYVVGNSSVEFYGEFAWLGPKSFRMDGKKTAFTSVV